MIVRKYDNGILLDIDGYRYVIDPRGMYVVKSRETVIYKGSLPELLDRIRLIDELTNSMIVHSSILVEEYLDKPVIPLPPNKLAVIINDREAKIRYIEVNSDRPLKVLEEVKKMGLDA